MLAILMQAAACCQLNQYLSGIKANSSSIKSQLQFCYQYVAQSICVPNIYRIYTQLSTANRDKDLKIIYLQNLQKIIKLDFQSSFSSKIVFNSDCKQGLKSLLCNLNFPKVESNISILPCFSECLSLAQKCSSVNFCVKIKSKFRSNC